MKKKNIKNRVRSFDTKAVLYPNGTIKFPGIDFSNREPLRKLALQDCEADILVVQHKGGSCWNGVGQPHVYVPAKYFVYQINHQHKDREGLVHLDVDRLCEIPASTRKGKVKCLACNGSGRYDNTGSPRCSSCNGTGKVDRD